MKAFDPKSVFLHCPLIYKHVEVTEIPTKQFGDVPVAYVPMQAFVTGGTLEGYLVWCLLPPCDDDEWGLCVASIDDLDRLHVPLCYETLYDEGDGDITDADFCYPKRCLMESLLTELDLEYECQDKNLTAVYSITELHAIHMHDAITQILKLLNVAHTNVYNYVRDNPRLRFRDYAQALGRASAISLYTLQGYGLIRKVESEFPVFEVVTEPELKHWITLAEIKVSKRIAHERDILKQLNAMYKAEVLKLDQDSGTEK